MGEHVMIKKSYMSYMQILHMIARIAVTVDRLPVDTWQVLVILVRSSQTYNDCERLPAFVDTCSVNVVDMLDECDLVDVVDNSTKIKTFITTTD